MSGDKIIKGYCDKKSFNSLYDTLKCNKGVSL